MAVNMTYTNTVMPLNDSDVTTQLLNGSDVHAGPTWTLMEKLVFGTWLSISMLCAIVGNFMVIVVVIRHKGMQTRTNMFLVNLAIADFLVGILLAPFSLITIIKDEWIFGDIMCNINGFLNNVCFITSIHTLMYISIHKYVSITRPFSRILNHWKILIMSMAAWLWSVICAILTMFILSKVVFKKGTMQCGPEYPKNKLEYLHHIIISGTNILIPLAVMTFAYARMYYEFRKHAVRLQKNTTLQSDQILGQQIQVTKTLFLVLACFMVCWLPYGAYSTYVSMIKNKSKILAWSNPAAYCFMYMNSGCNPIIYAWRSPSFREGYKEILCQKSSYIVSDVMIMEMFMLNVKRPSHSSTTGNRFATSRRDTSSSGLSSIIALSKHWHYPGNTPNTIRDSDSPSIIRRLSTLLHSSFRSSRMMSRRNSDCSSQNSLHMTRSLSTSSPTHTLLKRATSKTAKGSSIIRKDGSLIITKNGKIISVRRDIDSIKRDRSFAGFEDLKARRQNGVSKSLTEINAISENDDIELTPLLKRNLKIKSVSAMGHSTNQSPRMKFSHTSLTKIDSVDESEAQEGNPAENVLRIPPRLERQISRSSDAIAEYPRESTLPIILTPSERSNSPSVNSDCDDVFVQSPEKLSPMSRSQDGLINAMPLEPVLKNKKHLARSENNLDRKKHDPNGKDPVLSQSSDIVFKVPLLRCPSVEKLDTPTCIPRCSSDAATVRKLKPRSPLYIRRWLSNKLSDSKSKT